VRIAHRTGLDKKHEPNVLEPYKKEPTTEQKNGMIPTRAIGIKYNIIDIISTLPLNDYVILSPKSQKMSQTINCLKVNEHSKRLRNLKISQK